jgi:hypothetical protein
VAFGTFTPNCLTHLTDLASRNLLQETTSELPLIYRNVFIFRAIEEAVLKKLRSVWALERRRGQDSVFARRDVARRAGRKMSLAQLTSCLLRRAAMRLSTQCCRDCERRN